MRWLEVKPHIVIGSKNMSPHYFVCSACSRTSPNKTKFCPHCGEEMLPKRKR